MISFFLYCMVRKETRREGPLGSSLGTLITEHLAGNSSGIRQRQATEGPVFITDPRLTEI